MRGLTFLFFLRNQSFIPDSALWGHVVGLVSPQHSEGPPSLSPACSLLRCGLQGPGLMLYSLFLPSSGPI